MAETYSRLTRLVNKLFGPIGMSIAILAVAGLIGIYNWSDHLDWKEERFQHYLTMDMEIAETLTEVTLPLYFEGLEKTIKSWIEDPHSLKHIFLGLKGSDETEFDMVESLFNNYKDDIDAVIVQDEEGKLIDIHPEIPEAIGKDFSGFPGFNHASEHHETYLSNVFHVDSMNYLGQLYGEGENRYAVILTHPVYIKESNGEESIEKFAGTMSLVIKQGTLHRKFIDRLNTPDREVWLMDEKGQIICHPVRYHIGHDYYGVHRDNADVIGLDTVVKSIVSTGKDIGALFTYHGEEPGSRIEKLISTHTFKIYNQRITAGVTTPVESLAGPIRRDAIERTVVTLCLYTLFGLFGFAFYRIQRKKGILEATVESNEALRDSETKARTLIEESPVCTKIISLDSVLEFMSTSGLKSLGAEPGAVIGQHYPPDSYPESTKKRLTEHLERAKKGEVTELEATSRDTEGNDIWFHTTFIPVRNEEGETEYVIGVSIDTTERRKAEDGLKKELSINKALAQLAHAMISTVSVEEISSLVLEHARSLTNSEYGYVSVTDPKTGDNIVHTLTPMMEVECDVEGNDKRITFPKGPDGMYPSLWGHVLNTLEGFYTNDPGSHPSSTGIPEGHIPIKNFLTVPAVYDGKLVGQIALSNPAGPYTDDSLNMITQIAELYALSIHRNLAQGQSAELETQLQQVQKMESIGTLAGGIAHDFNNILMAIIGYAEIMVLFDVPQDSPIRPSLDEILKSANRAKDLVQQILLFSRQTEQEKKPLILSSIVKEVLKFLRASLPSTIEIRQDVETELGTILADPTQIYQVIMNLCANAGQAMAETGGVLTVALTAMDPDKEDAFQFPDLAPGSYLVLTVSDTGHGIDPDIQDRIFDPFFTTKERGEGTGMGLSVVHGIVKGHDGEIAVESEPGKGATFRVFLPSIHRKVESKSQDHLPPLPKGNETILFVDDESPLVDLAIKMLQPLGYKIVGRTDSRQALEAFQAQPETFDLVVTDLTMPHMTGMELAENLIKTRADIPIILCSGFSNKVSSEKVKAAGIREFVEKPLSSRCLSESVRQVLDSNQKE